MTTQFIDKVHAIVGPEGLVLGADMEPFLNGARYGCGNALCVMRPVTNEEVAALVSLCATYGVQLVAQGSNTGLVGASTPDNSGMQVVLSLTRLRRHFEVDVINRTVEVDAGMLLHELNIRLEPYGLWFPVDLAADPTIGGMISANTGGTRLLRYGDVRHNLLALEVVLFEPAGRLVRLGRPLRKNNTGFDLSQLFVGTSGAAGIVTRATLELAMRPQQSVTAMIVPSSEEAVTSLLTAVESCLGDFLSAFEGISANALRAALDHVPSLRNPFGAEPTPHFAILIELTSTMSGAKAGLDLEALLMEFLEERLGAEVIDAVLGRGDDLWRLRHSLSEGAKALGEVIGFDVSLRRSDLMRFRREAIDLVEAHYPQLVVVDFGHVGDGGLHFNLVWRNDCDHAYSSEVVDRVRMQIYDLVVTRYGGSFSAEHGVGPHNHHFYLKYTPPDALVLAGRLQRMLDPKRLSGRVSFGESREPVFHT